MENIEATLWKISMCYITNDSDYRKEFNDHREIANVS